MRSSRFLAAATTPPALVFQVSRANDLGVIRDHGVSQVESKRDAIGKPFLASRRIDGLKWIVATENTPLAAREKWRRQASAPEWTRSRKGARVDDVLSPKNSISGIKNVRRVALQIVRCRPSTRVEI